MFFFSFNIGLFIGLFTFHVFFYSSKNSFKKLFNDQYVIGQFVFPYPEFQLRDFRFFFFIRISLFLLRRLSYRNRSRFDLNFGRYLLGPTVPSFLPIDRFDLLSLPSHNELSQSGFHYMDLQDGNSWSIFEKQKQKWPKRKLQKEQINKYILTSFK